MKLKFEATDMVKMFDAEVKAGEHAAKRAMTHATTHMKNQWRGQIEEAGLGRRLARTIRSKVYPDVDSFDPAGFIWAKSPKIIIAHVLGLTIHSKNGSYLSIPTPAANMGRGMRRLSPGEWERRRGVKLRFVYRRNGPSLLVADKSRINKRGMAVASRSKTGRGFTTVPIFILVPQVKLKKRLDLAKLLDDGETIFWNDFVDFWK